MHKPWKLSAKKRRINIEYLCPVFGHEFAVDCRIPDCGTLQPCGWLQFQRKLLKGYLAAGPRGPQSKFCSRKESQTSHVYCVLLFWGFACRICPTVCSCNLFDVLYRVWQCVDCLILFVYQLLLCQAMLGLVKKRGQRWLQQLVYVSVDTEGMERKTFIANGGMFFRRI